MASKKKPAPTQGQEVVIEEIPVPSAEGVEAPTEGVTTSHIPYPSNLPDDVVPNANGDVFLVPVRTLPHRPVRYTTGSHPDDVQIGGHLPPDAEPSPLTPEQIEKIEEISLAPVDGKDLEALKAYLDTAPPVEGPDPQEFLKAYVEKTLKELWEQREYELINEEKACRKTILTFILRDGTGLEILLDQIAGFVLREGHPEQVILANGVTKDLATSQGTHAQKAKLNLEPYKTWQAERDPARKLAAFRQMIKEGVESGDGEPWDAEAFLARMKSKT